jgi:hypothetical protein
MKSIITNCINNVILILYFDVTLVLGITKNKLKFDFLLIFYIIFMKKS